MKYVFVTNVGQIYYRVLPLLADIDPKEITIVTFQPFADYFTFYTPFHVIELQSNPNLISRSPITTIKNLIQNSREYSKNFKDVRLSEIYFFGNSWRLGIFKHIQKLSTFNKTFYIPSNQSIPFFHYPKTLKSKLLGFIGSVITDLSIRIVSDTGVPSFELCPSFFKTNHIITKDEVLPPTHKFDLDLPVMRGKDILFVSEDLDDYVTNHEILNQLLKTIPEERSILKAHPNQTEYTKEMLMMSPLPRIVPSELYMNHPWKYVIGVESLALIKATQLTNAKVISLIELFDYKDPNRKQDLEKWQRQESQGQILFPKTIEEFKVMLK